MHEVRYVYTHNPLLEHVGALLVLFGALRLGGLLDLDLDQTRVHLSIGTEGWGKLLDCPLLQLCIRSSIEIYLLARPSRRRHIANVDRSSSDSLHYRCRTR